MLALVWREPLPSLAAALALVAVGAAGYGLSLRFYLLAQRAFGAARTGSVFAFAPFIGAALAVALGDRAFSAMMLLWQPANAGRRRAAPRGIARTRARARSDSNTNTRTSMTTGTTPTRTTRCQSARTATGIGTSRCGTAMRTCRTCATRTSTDGCARCQAGTHCSGQSAFRCAVAAGVRCRMSRPRIHASHGRHARKLEPPERSWPCAGRRPIDRHRGGRRRRTRRAEIRSSATAHCRD